MPFWLSAVCAALMPTSIGYQDLAAFFARQPGVSERWREHLIASPFGTIHAATFSFTRPIGTAMPRADGPAARQFRSARARRENLVGRRAADGSPAQRNRVSDRQSPAQGRSLCRCREALRPEPNRRACRSSSRSMRRRAPPTGPRRRTSMQAAEEREDTVASQMRQPT